MTALFILIVFFLLPYQNSHLYQNLLRNQQNWVNMNNNGEEDDYTYIRELRNGVWWIIVYNAEGIIINEYPDPNQ
jgi:hypothetical protein